MRLDELLLLAVPCLLRTMFRRTDVPVRTLWLLLESSSFPSEATASDGSEMMPLPSYVLLPVSSGANPTSKWRAIRKVAIEVPVDCIQVAKYNMDDRELHRFQSVSYLHLPFL